MDRVQHPGRRWKVGINLVDAAGGSPVPVVRHPADDVAPSFSRDGKWLYFGSNRANRYEIYRVPATGGEAVRVTDNGGHVGFESVDGKSIYYTKTNLACGPLFMRSLAGGPEYKVLDSVCARAFQVTERGIYYIGRRIRLFDPVTRKSSDLRKTKVRIYDSPRLAVSPDGTILIGGLTESGSDLYLVENFR